MREPTQYTRPDQAIDLAIKYLNRQPCLGQLEFDIEDAIQTLRSLHEREVLYLVTKAENDRLTALINHPHTTDFVEAVKLEAVHQCERWGIDVDTKKTDAEWFWLVGYLAGKALGAGGRVDAELGIVEEAREKRLHHIITTAAVLLNWHAHRVGAR